MNEYHLPVDILIADDHRIMTDGLALILKDEKSIGQIFIAHDGNAACAKAREENIDLVIMDINMPVLNGIEATKIIKQEKPFVKIIMVSMIADAGVVSKAIKAGADAFIIKNTGRDELIKAIAKVMADEKYISEELSFDLFHTINRRQPRENNSIHLTTREKEIIRHIAEGMTNQEIADKLFISPRTVDTHRKNILNKLELRNTAALVRYAADNKLF
ncbi:MAG: response regulator transcription factor [Gemmatimonadaceae bacterium]|nr:response regulator transcription factor [Chitinophagaceae bacterium]